MEDTKPSLEKLKKALGDKHEELVKEPKGMGKEKDVFKKPSV